MYENGGSHYIEIFKKIAEMTKNKNNLDRKVIKSSFFSRYNYDIGYDFTNRNANIIEYSPLVNIHFKNLKEIYYLGEFDKQYEFLFLNQSDINW